MRFGMFLIVCLSASSLAVSCNRGGSSGSRRVHVGARVLFPTERTLTDADSILVRGETDQRRPVQSVTVNGVAATSNDGFATFEARVPLVLGLNDLTVQVTDVSGRTNSNAATVEVAREGPIPVGPIDVAVEDPDHVVLLDATRRIVVRVDLTTGERTSVSGAGVGTGPLLSEPTALVVVGSSIYVTDLGAVIAIDRTTGARTVLSDDVSAGSGPPLGILTDVEFLGVVGQIHVSSASTDAIVAIDLATGDRVEVSGPSVGSGPLWATPSGFATHPGGLLVVDQVSNALFSADVVTGARTLVSDDATGSGPSLDQPVRVRWDSAGLRAIVVSNGGAALIAVDIVTGDRTVLSDQGTGSGPQLVDPIGLAFFPGQPRALVVDRRGRRSLVAIDLATGNRSLVFDPRTGLGIDLVAPVDVDHDPDINRLYVLDAGQDALVAVQTDTGDRRAISLNSSGTLPSIAGTGLALDPTRDRVLCAVGAEIVAVDVNSGVRMRIAGPSDGTGFVFDDAVDLCVDVDNSRAFVANGSPPAVFAIDLLTGMRSVVSSHADGSGPAFGSEISGIAWHDGASQILVLDPTQSLLFSVEPSTGLRTVVADADVDATLFAADAIEVDEQRLLGFASVPSRIVLVQLATSDLLVRSEDGAEPGPWLGTATGLRFDTRRLLWAVTPEAAAVFAIDATSGDRVLASR